MHTIITPNITLYKVKAVRPFCSFWHALFLRSGEAYTAIL